MFSNLGAVFKRALTLVVLSGAVYSQSAPAYGPSPFNLIGTIDSMTLTAAAGPLAGGTLTVNGFNIVIPKNTLVTLPSITVAWSELFVNGKPNLPLLGSVSWEATVFGNVVSGQNIAGLVYIAQESTQLLQGFIASINFATGHFFVDTTECVLNDPLGRYGLAYTSYPLWSVDSDNPSVHASTGFPLCIPRNTTDPECPLTNRPVDKNNKYLSTFTYPDPAKVTKGGLDPRIMAPLAVGDYVTFSGIKTPEGVLAIYSLEANLGIWTAPGTKPAYITAERAQYAIIDPNPNLATGETRYNPSYPSGINALIFFPSLLGAWHSELANTATTIEFYAIDVDPCTGDETERSLVIAQPSSVAPVGRVTYRLGKQDASPATREVGFRYTNGPSPGPRGLTVGQFIQPIFEYIFPELTTFGTQQIPFEFNVMPFLAKGSGPFTYGNYLAAPPATPTIVGQLSPWPGSPTPAATSCPPPSTTTATSTPPATVTPKPVKDKITIISAVASNKKGQTTTSVTASSNSTLAQLFLAITGVDNVAATAMTKQANGQFSLDISTKGKPSSVTVTSSQGADPVSQAV
ncbi:hypothetical protein C8R44DRAFT_974860 [Mycena epipterygia]|nr:hypothetical protein C8R44DRAFT_974860 [Mycena epipterygia]